MGANPYCYFTPYSSDIQATLELLRQQEFEAGRYEPCFHQRTGKYLFELDQAPRDSFPAPGAIHASIDDVFGEVSEDGTNSILDIFRVVDEPFSVVDDPLLADDIMERFNIAAPIAETDLIAMFGTTRPTKQQVEEVLLAGVTIQAGVPNSDRKSDVFWDQIGRGDARYIITYDGDLPDKIFFAGYSFD